MTKRELIDALERLDAPDDAIIQFMDSAMAEAYIVDEGPDALSVSVAHDEDETVLIWLNILYVMED